MIFNKNIARKTAEVLLQIHAIKLSPKEPFNWASGWKSPIYCDNRIALSFPPIRNYVREKIAKHVEKSSTKGANFDQNVSTENILEDDLTIIGIGK